MNPVVSFICRLAQLGHTPLHLVSNKGHLDVARQLLDKGAKLDILNNVSFPSACHTALKCSSRRVCLIDGCLQWHAVMIQELYLQTHSLFPSHLIV